MVVNATPRPFYSWERDPKPILFEAACAPRPIWTDEKYLTAIKIRSLDRAAGGKSLYRIRYTFFKNS